MKRRKLILGCVRDLVRSLLYDDRKEDEKLPREAIEESIWLGELTKEDIVAEFKQELDTWLRR